MNDLSFKEWLFAEELEDMDTQSSDPAGAANTRDWPSWYRRVAGEPKIGATRWERPGGGTFQPPKRKSAWQVKEPGAYRRASKKVGPYVPDPNHDVALQDLTGITPPSGRSWTREIGNYAVRQFRNIGDAFEIDQKINTALNDFITRYNDPTYGRRFAGEDGMKSFMAFKDRIEQAPTDEAKVNIVKFAIRKAIAQQFSMDAKQLGKVDRLSRQQRQLGAKLSTPVQNISVDDLQSFVGSPDYGSFMRQGTGSRLHARDWMRQGYITKKIQGLMKDTSKDAINFISQKFGKEVDHADLDEIKTELMSKNAKDGATYLSQKFRKEVDPEHIKQLKLIINKSNSAVNLISQMLGREVPPDELEKIRGELESKGYALPQEIYYHMMNAVPEVQQLLRDARDEIHRDLMDGLAKKQGGIRTGSGRPVGARGIEIHQAAIDILDDYIKGKPDLQSRIIQLHPDFKAFEAQRAIDIIKASTTRIVDLYGDEEQKRIYKAYTTRRERGKIKRKETLAANRGATSPEATEGN